MKENDKPVAVTMGWDLRPTLVFSDGKILSKKAELCFYPEYYPDGCEWPIDPTTGLNMPIEEH